MEENFEERKGYHFAGWYVDEECTKRINPGGILPSTMTLYDKWIPILYPVTYDCQGGMNSRRNPKFVTVESGVQKLYPARKNGAVFDCWLLDGKRIDILPESVDHPITLVASYRQPCTVSFKSYGGGQIKPRQIGADGKLKPFPSPMKIGYEFVGWYYDVNYKLAFSFDDPIREDLTLFARFEVKHYKITYVMNGGFNPRANPAYYTFHDEQIKLLPAKKKNHEFLGWFDRKGKPRDIIPKNSIGDKVFVARFRKYGEIE